MRLTNLVDTSRAVAASSGRRDKIGRLADLLRRTPPHEVETAVGYLTGQVPQGRLGIGWATLDHARPESSAATPSLTLDDVAGAFDRIASVTGRGSTAEKRRTLNALLARGTREEQEFLRRLLSGELRQGALEGIMRDAVAAAARVPVSAVRRAAMLAGTIGPVARAALAHGRPGLTRFSLQVLTPLQPMLAQAADGVDDALDGLSEAGLEYKLDGARIQVHKAGDEVRVFSRKRRDVTAAVPEVVEAVNTLGEESLVFDGEVIALRDDGRPYPFQVTARRFGRKLDLVAARRAVPLTPFLFDVLHAGGESLIDSPYRDRWHVLSRVVPSRLIVPRTRAASRVQGAAFLRQALDQGHEGIMVKGLDATYQAGSRGKSWRKIKQARTLDLVVLAAEWGSGRRQGRLSNLHLGARDPRTGGFVMLGKTFKGLTDDLLRWQTATLQALAVSWDQWTVYVRPSLVVEIAFNDVQESAQYPGGVTLRFARVKRYRLDKPAAEADTIDSVRGMRPSGS